MPVSQICARSCALLLVISMVGGSAEAGNVFENAADALACPQNLALAAKIDDEAFMRSQIDCFHGRGKCDEAGCKARRKYSLGQN